MKTRIIVIISTLLFLIFCGLSLVKLKNYLAAKIAATAHTTQQALPSDISPATPSGILDILTPTDTIAPIDLIPTATPYPITTLTPRCRLLPLFLLQPLPIRHLLPVPGCQRSIILRSMFLQIQRRLIARQPFPSNYQIVTIRSHR